MCTAHQNRQPPAPRGLGGPQIGHLELEGKTNHSELWDAFLCSETQALAAEGCAGGVGMLRVLESRAAGNRGAPKPQAGPFRIFLWVPWFACFFSPFLFNPLPHIHTRLSPRIYPRQGVLRPPPITPPDPLGRFCSFICHFLSLLYALQGCFKIALGLRHSLETSPQSYKLN